MSGSDVKLNPKYSEFFNILPKYALVPILQLVPAKFEVIDTYFLAYVFVQHGVMKKVVSDNLKECASKIIKQQLKPVAGNTKTMELTEMKLSDECELLLENVLFFKRKYNSLINSNLLTTYVSYLMVCDDRLNSYRFFEDCLYVQEKKKVRQSLLSEITNTIHNDLSEKLQDYGRYLTSPVLQYNYDCFGREEEIEECVNVLSKMKKSNVLLTGNTGVGKTSIVYGICNYLQSDRCPKNLLSYNVFELNTNKLVSGTTYRGDLEKRLDDIISELRTHNNTILFIDEIHSILNRSGSDDSSPVQNVLKPYLAENSKMIGCTTDKEYKLLEKDRAFERRFSVVHVSELNEDQTVETLKLSKDKYEKYHNIQIPQEILNYVVSNCKTYIKNRYFPDKAFDVLDMSCVNCTKRDANTLEESDVDKSISALSGLDSNKDILFRISDIQQELCNHILGQDNAIKSLCKCFKKYYLGISDKNKPIGNFLFVGPTGTGKTELCKKLAEYFFTPECFIRFDMSEFMEKHTVSKFIGSPPGYVGHDSGGVLTEHIKHHPFSICLFDEIEKAHPDVTNVLLQIMDDGRLTDSFGTVVDFCNCLIVMTSNLGCKEFLNKNGIGFGASEDNSIISKSIKDHFSPEFINRLDEIVYFNKITKEVYETLLLRYIDEYKNKMLTSGIELNISDNAISELKDRCYDEKSGARYIRRKVFGYLDDIIVDLAIGGDSEITVDSIVKK